MAIKIYIPLSTCNSEKQELSRGVADSIARQTVLCEIVKCYAPGVLNSSRNYSAERCAGEAASRYLCRVAAIESGDEFCIMQDRDIVHNKTYNIEYMIAALAADATIGMIGIKPGSHDDYPGTIDIGCCAWRVAAMPVFVSAVNLCMCPAVCNAVLKSGFKVVSLNIQNGITEV